MKLFLVIILLLCLSCGHTYYIVRHAEKADAGANMMSSDVPLTEKGKERAVALEELLKNKKIAYVYSTNTIRTKSTAQPTADYFKLPVNIYGPGPDSAFIAKLKAVKKNTLIIAHSNTVDDIVNGLCGEKKVMGDLDESEYNKLFIIEFKGKKIRFAEKAIFPKATVTPRF